MVPLRAPVLWLPTRRTSVEGRTCREYAVTDDVGSVLLTARAFLWRRDIVVAEPGGQAVFTIVRSHAFPATGKATVRELPSGLAIGTVHRNGTFRNSTGAVRGRFRDARSFRDRTAESVFQGAMEVIMSTGADSMPSGPDALLLQVDEAIVGTLTYGPLPFATQDEVPRSPSSRMLRRFIQKTWKSLNAPRGWQFVRFSTTDDDPRLLLAAALFAAELSRW